MRVVNYDARLSETDYDGSSPQLRAQASLLNFLLL